MAEITPNPGEDFYLTFLSSPHGRRSWTLLKDEFYHRPSYVPGMKGRDGIHGEGQRSVICWIMSLMLGYRSNPYEGDPLLEDNPAYDIFAASQEDLFSRPSPDDSDGIEDLQL